MAEALFGVLLYVSVLALKDIQSFVLRVIYPNGRVSVVPFFSVTSSSDPQSDTYLNIPSVRQSI